MDSYYNPPQLKLLLSFPAERNTKQGPSSIHREYEPRLGKTDANRIVVSNIHKGGLVPAEAGAEILELIQKILKEKQSGVGAKLD